MPYNCFLFLRLIAAHVTGWGLGENITNQLCSMKKIILKRVKKYVLIYILQSARRIGEIFVEYKERFLKYGEYCSSLQLAQETLDSLCAKCEDVAAEVTNCEKCKLK